MEIVYQSGNYIKTCGQCKFNYPCMANPSKRLCKRDLIKYGKPASEFNVEKNQLACHQWEDKS